MTCRMLLTSARVPGVLLAFVALTTSGMLQGQAHPPALEPPDIRWLVLPEDRLKDEEIRGADPCHRDRNMERLDWDREAWLAFCVQRARSSFVSQAWRRGLDTDGERLQPDAPTRKLAEMELWLRHLPGKYRIEGKYWNSGGSNPVRGTADCFGIGSGPGVSCMISTQYEAPKEAGNPDSGTIKDRRLDHALYNAMRGLVLLFGVDPGASLLRVTLVDFRAIATSGFLEGGVVMLEGRPDIERLFGHHLVTYTWQTTFIATGPDGDLTAKFLVRAADSMSTPKPILFDLRLHREAPAMPQ